MATLEVSGDRAELGVQRNDANSTCWLVTGEEYNNRTVVQSVNWISFSVL